MPYDSTDFVVTDVPAPTRDPKTITDPRERVAFLRDFLRHVPQDRFHMRQWVSNIGGASYSAEPADLLHDCGTVACIGGWAEGLFCSGRNDPRDARTLLGLGDDEASALFYAWDGPGLHEISQHMAANVLDAYLRTGKIDWSVA